MPQKMNKYVEQHARNEFNKRRNAIMKAAHDAQQPRIREIEADAQLLADRFAIELEELRAKYKGEASIGIYSDRYGSRSNPKEFTASVCMERNNVPDLPDEDQFLAELSVGDISDLAKLLDKFFPQ